MEIKKCVKCGYVRDDEIDADTPAGECPRCGVIYKKAASTKINKPVMKSKSSHTGTIIIATLVFVLIAVIVGGIYANKSISYEKIKAEQLEKAQKLAAIKKRKSLEYEQCKNDLKCWGRFHDGYAMNAAKDKIERSSKYSFEWIDGFTGSKITTWRWLNKKDLTLIFLGDQIKFQNAFGAWEQMIYRIDYDPVNKIVLNITIKPGRL